MIIYEGNNHTEKLYMIIYEQFILIVSNFSFYKKNKAKNYSLIIFYFFLSFIIYKGKLVERTKTYIYICTQVFSNKYKKTLRLVIKIF